jgi:hypothetical protein
MHAPESSRKYRFSALVIGQKAVNRMANEKVCRLRKDGRPQTSQST